MVTSAELGKMAAEAVLALAGLLPQNMIFEKGCLVTFIKPRLEGSVELFQKGIMLDWNAKEILEMLAALREKNPDAAIREAASMAEAAVRAYMECRAAA